MGMIKADGRHEDFYQRVVNAGLELKLSEAEMVAIVGRAIGYNNAAKASGAGGPGPHAVHDPRELGRLLVDNIREAQRAFGAGEVRVRSDG